MPSLATALREADKRAPDDGFAPVEALLGKLGDDGGRARAIAREQQIDLTALACMELADLREVKMPYGSAKKLIEAFKQLKDRGVITVTKDGEITVAKDGEITIVED